MKMMKMDTDDDQRLPLSFIESNILPSLGAKSLGRCMCVCKQWNTFLSTPTFARMHLHHVTVNDHKLLLLDSMINCNQSFRTIPVKEASTTIRSNPINPNPDPTAEFILGSLDGLVCLASPTDDDKQPTTNKYKLAFWNPLTGAYKKLSTNPYSYNFPPWNFPMDAIGFYTSCDHDYKLVCLMTGGLFGAYIYSHRRDSWRQIEFSFVSDDPCTWSPPTLWGQCLYFVVTSTVAAATSGGGGFRRRSWIICFDVKTENFRKIRFPGVQEEAARDYFGSLVVLDGSLHLCVSDKMYTTNYKFLNTGDLWRMIMDGGGDHGWVKVVYYKFRGRDICCMPPSTTTTPNWLALLDQKNSFFEDQQMDMEDITTHYWCFSSQSWKYRSRRIMYVETLVSPKNP